MHRILIIEDEPAIRKQMAQVLRFEGYEALEAENGRLGTATAFSSVPDLIICDITMPELDGFGVLQALREDQRTALIPFIFLTALGASQDLRHGMDEGADDYLIKPYQPEALLGSVRRRLEKRDRQIQECLLRAEEVVLENITQCQQTEAALRWKTGFLEAQVNTLVDGILVTDQQGQKLLQNQRLSDLFSIPPPIAHDKDHARQLIWTSNRAKNSEQFIEKVAYLYAHPGEISRDEIELKDGTVLDRYTSPLLGQDGTYFGRLWSFRDITASKQVDSIMRESRQCLQLQTTALESCANAVIITDLKGTIEWVNTAFSQLTGYSATEVVGQNPRVLKSGEHPDSFYKEMWETISRGHVWEGEIINRHRDGGLYHEAMTITPVPDGSGTIAHFIAVKQDITERKSTQAARENLERKVSMHKENEERACRALAHEQELSGIKNQFVSMVSHEFRSPLSIISLSAELLDGGLDELGGAERSEQLKEIQSAVKRMTQMLSDFLVHGNCTSGKMACQPARVEVPSLCRRLISEVLRECGSHHAIECTFDPAVREAWLDEKIVRHILGNLLSNAVKYSSDGEPVKLEVKRIAGSPQPNGGPDPVSETHLEFKVTDSGIGIPVADMAKLYQTFHRAANVGNRPGTGMGLVIVKQFVDLHRGTIRFESQEGKGTTVWVALPAASPAAPAEN